MISSYLFEHTHKHKHTGRHDEGMQRDAHVLRFICFWYSIKSSGMESVQNTRRKKQSDTEIPFRMHHTSCYLPLHLQPRLDHMTFSWEKQKTPNRPPLIVVSITTPESATRAVPSYSLNLSHRYKEPSQTLQNEIFQVLIVRDTIV